MDAIADVAHWDPLGPHQAHNEAIKTQGFGEDQDQNPQQKPIDESTFFGVSPFHHPKISVFTGKMAGCYQQTIWFLDFCTWFTWKKHTREKAKSDIIWVNMWPTTPENEQHI
jgi:ribulose kinase